MNRAELPRTADIVVVGGGIAGASAAYHAARAGADVLLVERDTVGGGATSAAVGVLSPPIRQPYHETIRWAGEDRAKRLWEFALRSIRGLAEVIGGEHASSTELDLTGGFQLAEPHSQHEMEAAFEALERAGLPVRWIDASELQKRCPCASGFTGAIELEGGGAIAPGQTARALATAAEEAGATVVEGVAVGGVVEEGDELRCSIGDAVVSSRAAIHAAHVDIRTFSPFMDREVVPIRGQGFRTNPLPKVFEGGFSTHWKLNVWRQDADGRLIVSGWRHDAWDRAYGHAEPDLDPQLQEDLVEWFRGAFRRLGPFEIRERWSGVFGWTADFLPLVGRVPGSSRELVTTGFSGGGLPFAFEAGRTVAALALDQEPPEGSGLFDPARFSPR